MQAAELSILQICAQAHGVDPRAPQAFVGIDVSHSAKDTLIEQERFDSRATPPQLGEELRSGCFQRVQAELAESSLVPPGGKYPHLAEAADVGVAEFAAVVQSKEDVGMRLDGRLGRAGYDLPGHSQMDQQREILRAVLRVFQFDDEKLSMPSHAVDPAAGQITLQCGRVLNEIRFAQAHSEDAPSGQDRAQTSNNCLDFG